MKLLRIAALSVALLACATVASASTIWNFQNTVFNRSGNLINVTGYFVLNTAGTGFDDWDILANGTWAPANHHYDFGIAGEQSFFVNNQHFGFYCCGFAGAYLDLFFAAPITNSPGTINLVAPSLACQGCGTLVSGSVTTLSVNQTAAVPEPATLVLCGIGAMFAASRLRRRQ